MISGQMALEYRGEAVSLGRMSSYDAAKSIIAFSDFMGIVSRRLYGEKVELRTEIQGFRGESFDTEFVFLIGGVLTTLLSQQPASPKQVWDFIAASIRAWRHLDGKPPKSVTQDADHAACCYVENHLGAKAYITNNVYNLVVDQRAGEAIKGFVRDPLESGLESVRLSTEGGKQEIEMIPSGESHAFVPISAETVLTEFTAEMNVVVMSPDFKEGNKWRFSDGQAEFYAGIEDDAFNGRIARRQIRFGLGDVLRVSMNVKQVGAFRPDRQERTILAVLDYCPAPVQEELL